MPPLSRRARGVFPALLAGLVGMLLSACDGRAPASTTRGSSGETTVVAEPVRMEAERTRIEAVGTARALRSVDLHPEAAGEVVAIHFEPGQQVAAGAVLLELHARDQRLALELAEVRLAEARRLLERYDAANQPGDRLVPETTVDTARSALEAARIQRDRAAVALDHRFVTAPFDGVVGLTDVDVGDRIDPATRITTLDDRSALLVRFPVPEAFVGRIDPGDPIRIDTWTADRSRATGRVVDLGSRIDPVTRAFTARARVPNPDDLLRPGMSFRVNLELTGREWPSVPEVAVLWGGDGPYLWVLDEGIARRVEVRLVGRREGRVLVDGDLSAGTLVVAEGVQRMRPGLPVRQLDADALDRDARSALASDGETAPG